MISIGMLLIVWPSKSGNTSAPIELKNDNKNFDFMPYKNPKATLVIE
jgi:hypothetical protein